MITKCSDDSRTATGDNCVCVCVSMYTSESVCLCE